MKIQETLEDITKEGILFSSSKSSYMEDAKTPWIHHLDWRRWKLNNVDHELIPTNEYREFKEF